MTQRYEFVGSMLEWLDGPRLGFESDIKFLQSAYDNIVPHIKPHWISVEDELPPLKQDVLIYDEDEDVIIVDARWEERNRAGWDWSSQLEPTHWMPLPAPPVLSNSSKTVKQSNFDENCEKYRTVFDGWEDLTFEERRDRINKFRSGQW